jgi:hypothetical protein
LLHLATARALASISASSSPYPAKAFSSSEKLQLHSSNVSLTSRLTPCLATKLLQRNWRPHPR